MSRPLREEELASGLLKYIVISVPFLLFVISVLARLLNADTFNGAMVIFVNDDPDSGELMMPPIMAYLAACVINSGLNMLYFFQFSSRFRAFGPRFQQLNYLAPGLIFLGVMLLRQGFDFSMHSVIFYLAGATNIFYGFMVWRNLRYTEVVT